MRFTCKCLVVLDNSQFSNPHRGILGRLFARSLRLLLTCATLAFSAGAKAAPSSGARFPAPEKLTYLIEWRMVNAGSAIVDLTHASNNAHAAWDFALSINSAGLVSRLYRVQDSYQVTTSDRFCALSAHLDAAEGKKHTVSRFTVDSPRKKLFYEEQDKLTNKIDKRELSIMPCTYDIVGALAALRTLDLEPGKSTVLPITTGRKFAEAKIEAQGKDTLKLNGKTYSATRYEAFVFDNILYKRHGRLLIWLSDEPGHVPLQFRLVFGFPIGGVTVTLQKQER